MFDSALTFCLVTTVVKFAVLVVGFVLPMASLLTWMERRQSALSQDRLGPTRAHFFTVRGRPVTLGGLVHVIADATKMLFKEPFRPAGADTLVFHLAPAVGFVSSVLIVAFVPFGPDVVTGWSGAWAALPLQLVRLDTGLLWTFGLGSLGIYGTALAGWSSNNKFAMLGGLRASAQIISYEVALGLTLVGMLLVCGTTELSEMLTVQHQAPMWGVVPRWGLFLQPAGALLFLVAAMAETKRAPFDCPEGESEIIGYFLEYSSMGFGLFMLGEFVEVVVLAALFSTLFLGGWALPWVAHGHGVSFGLFTLHPGSWGFALLGMGVFAAKTFLMCALQLQIRWTLPRFRYDQLMNVGWKMLLPLALANLAVSATLLWLDPTLELMMVVGLLFWGAFALVVAVGPKRAPAPRRRQHHTVSRATSASPAAAAGDRQGVFAHGH